MAQSNLDAIRTLIRRITRSPSESQLSTVDCDEAINTFILYDFPNELRLFDLRTVLTFYTQPFVDTYDTVDTPITDPLYNFKNKYISVHQPVFFAGIQGYYTQRRDVFYGNWPQTNSIAESGLTGNGTTGPFSGTIVSHPMLANSVIINCVDITGEAMILVDYPFSNIFGYLGIVGQDPGIPSPYGSVNYVTGAFTAIFPNNTAAGAPIIVENIGYQPSKPIAMLYFQDKFILRPVPDGVYQIQIEADVRPTELLADDQSPELHQWWQYIAYGAAIKIFQYRSELDDVNLNMPEFKRQERLVLRPTLMQQANERTVTIYTQGKNYGYGGSFFGSWPY